MEKKSMRRVLPAAPTLVDEAGMPRLGVFAGEFARLNLEDTTLRASGIPLPRGLVRFRVKEWFHAGVLLPRGYLGFAIINSKMLGLSFTSYINLDGRAVEHRTRRPRGKKVPADMRAGELHSEVRPAWRPARQGTHRADPPRGGHVQGREPRRSRIRRRSRRDRLPRSAPERVLSPRPR